MCGKDLKNTFLEIHDFMTEEAGLVGITCSEYTVRNLDRWMQMVGFSEQDSVSVVRTGTHQQQLTILKCWF